MDVEQQTRWRPVFEGESKGCPQTGYRSRELDSTGTAVWEVRGVVSYEGEGVLEIPPHSMECSSVSHQSGGRSNACLGEEGVNVGMRRCLHQ